MSKKKDFMPDPKAEELSGKIQTAGQGEAGSTNPAIDSPKGGSPEIKEFEEPKAAINTKQAAEVVTAGSNSNGVGGLRRGAMVFSGGAGVTQGDLSATTKEDAPYKSGDRTGRRADPITRKIDLLDAEIIKTKRYQSKPLCETSDGVGYNGNYENEHAITQKNSGGCPADPMFERSVDILACDMLYHAHGQFNIAKGTKNLSIHTWDSSLNSGNGGYAASPTVIPVGNFLARKLTVKIDSNFNITDFSFDKSDLSPDAIDEATSRLAGDAYLRERNVRELDRNTMISVAGNESDPSWSCLGDAIIDPTDQNLALYWIDALAGNYTGLSVRKLDESLAFQINKAAKDGARITGPMAEMVNGNIPVANIGVKESVSEANGRTQCFNSANYVKGSAALWLAVNDSLAKYTTKGKLLSLPLSFKSAVATAKSNMDPLVANQLLFDELKHAELFSTIDGPYDPLKPVVMTDKAGIISPIPLDLGCTFDSVNHALNTTIYVMHYENLRNRYNIGIRNFFIAGIFRWFNERAGRLYDACKDQKDGSGIVTIEIPIVSSTTSISLWDLIVCSSVPYIVEERLSTFTEVLKYEKNHGYPYSGSVHLKDVDIDACDNYNFSSTESQISVGTAKPVSAMKFIMPEVFWPILKKKAEEPTQGANGIAAYTVLPHYFIQNQFVYDKNADNASGIRKLVLSDECATCAYPTTRSGNMFSYFDTVYGMSEEDYRLSLDRMVVYPGYQHSYAKNKLAGIAAVGSGVDQVFDTKTYKYGKTCDGSVVIPYFAYANNAADKEYTLTVGDVIGTPRELGLYQVAPAGLLTPVNYSGNLNTVAVDSAYLALSGPGFRAYIYHGFGKSMQNTILNNADINIDANASFKNDYVVIDATPASAGTDFGCLLKAPEAVSVLTPIVDGSYTVGHGSYSSTTGVYEGTEAKDTTTGFELNSLFKYFWTRLQRLPFVVNPFDCNTNDLSTGSSTWTAINKHDIYDLLYIFGFAGFRASDYHETVYSRVRERVAKGMNYVADPFTTKSLLLK